MPPYNKKHNKKRDKSHQHKIYSTRADSEVPALPNPHHPAPQSSEEGKVKRASAARFRSHERNMRRDAKREREAREEELRQQKEIEDRLAQEAAIKEQEEEIARRVQELYLKELAVLGSMFYEPNTKVHRHTLVKKEEYRDTVVGLERSRGQPLDALDPRFKALDTNNVDKMSERQRNACEAAIDIMSEWTECVGVVTNNGSQKHPINKKEFMLETAPKRLGSMYGMGYHPATEPGGIVKVAAYSPLSGKREQYKKLIPYLPRVASTFRLAMLSLRPAAFSHMADVSYEDSLPNFSDPELGTDTLEPGYANSLTITKNDFANFSHLDNDLLPYAYGWWWPARLTPSGYKVSWKDNDQIRGGAFLLGDFGVAIDFERCNNCLVEINWRGKKDLHCTMQSQSRQCFTRFGTSVQITERGAEAVARHWAMPEQKQEKSARGYYGNLNRKLKSNK
ncbi:hypothetical protein CVT24_010580 [Panaeolus cyanescens]|uniref:Tet-like 2OG-Fe(II) oxygenase domain-containing protein n=1 Tax=Panaeolus cyanescens TaxID=181874 RepID=A0A409WB08_9AGAR|nr:hypothetical protein CVT24_010580 [Panaeolus cyanescens]